MLRRNKLGYYLIALVLMGCSNNDAPQAKYLQQLNEQKEDQQPAAFNPNFSDRIPIPEKTAQAFRRMLKETPQERHGSPSVPLGFFEIDGKAFAFEAQILSLSVDEGVQLVWHNETTKKITIIISEEQYVFSPKAMKRIFEAIENHDPTAHLSR